MIGKGLFHTHLVVSNLEKSLKFYTGLFGMQKINFEDGTLVFLTTPGAVTYWRLIPAASGVIQEDAARKIRVRKASPESKVEWHISDTCCRAWRIMNAPSPTSLNLADGWWFVASTAAQ